MLFHNDVVTEREAKPSALSCGFGGKERIEHPFLYLRWNPATIVANSDFHVIAKVLSRRR